ncbi:MAG: hypothetical protein ABIL70_05800 [candidate division WOR-3 bacterium]
MRVKSLFSSLNISRIAYSEFVLTNPLEVGKLTKIGRQLPPPYYLVVKCLEISVVCQGFTPETNTLYDRLWLPFLVNE